MTRTQRRWIGVLGALALVGSAIGLLGIGAALDAPTPDERRQFCAADRPGREVIAEFEMTARDYEAHIPRMGHAPELETNERVFVVAFEGAVEMPGAAGAPPAVDEHGRVIPREPVPETASGVVCIVRGTDATWYVDVDTTGIRP